MKKKKLSVLKRERQNKKRRLLNYARKRKIKTLTKKLYRLINKSSQAKQEETSIDTLIKEVEDLRNALIQAIDKAAKRRVIHKNTASRKKSKVARKVAEFINSCKNQSKVE